MLASAIAWAGDTVIISTTVGPCKFSLEADEEWHALRLRTHHPRYQPCNVSQKAAQRLLASAFTKTEEPRLQGEYTSLFVGRMIDYPWLSHDLAETAHRDPHWNKKKGRPIKMEINRYIADLLFNQDLLKPFRTELVRYGYRLEGVSVEKVLVGSSSDPPGPSRKKLSGSIPFDAMVWIQLRKQPNQ